MIPSDLLVIVGLIVALFVNVVVGLVLIVVGLAFRGPAIWGRRY